ncbi:MAG: prepilin-type N-terminal cleavage/methylation domain-containing protein [Cytophagales bacterium]|nr:prepilin-type N-terminal cleavage/methylation domain-containing protein [Rhizobacter sp.]
MQAHKPLPPRGFTLIEVLVSMMIMAILAVMAWQGVDGIVRTRTASQERLEQLLRVNTVLAQFEQDLEAAQDSGALPQGLPSFDGISLRLTRRTPDGLQLVVWSLRGGTWLRWAGPAVTTTRALQDHWMNSQQFLGNESGQLRTLTGITEWQTYCFRGNAWSNCQSSAGVAEPAPPVAGNPGQAPPPQAADPLKAVRVVLTFGEGSGFSGSITRQIALGPQ